MTARPVIPLTPALPAIPASDGAVRSWVGAFTKAVSDLYGVLARRADSVLSHGLASERPAASGSRRFWFNTDTGVAQYDDGTWRSVGGAGAHTHVPADVTFSATDKALGRAAAGGGAGEELALTPAGRALIDDADAAAQRTTLGLGALAVKATVATADIDAAAVTYAKIQNVSATDKVLGRVTAGAGSVEEIACTAAGRALIDDADAAAQRTTLALNNVTNDAQIAKSIGTTKGDVVGFTGASTPVRVGVGADGQVLVADSASAPGIKWAAAPGGGVTFDKVLAYAALRG